jgi:uncharacterized delta-60 repeat protein
LPGTLVLDAVRQPDGKVVGVGRTRPDPRTTASTLTVFRVLPHGALDSTFGDDGVVQYTADQRVPHGATSVALEPDGRIVVAGTHDGGLLVLRLLQDGTRDPTFGGDGVVTRTEFAGDARLVRTPDGGYRITTHLDALVLGRCRIVALTADGNADQGFGPDGSVDAVPDITGSSACHDVAIQPDGRLLIAGTAYDGGDSSGVLVRLLADGSPDDSFVAPAVSQSMAQATALAVDAVGNVFVAGHGPFGTAGASVARLNASGVLDTTYGDAGTTWIDLPSQWAEVATVYDMVAGANGSLTVSGGRGAGSGYAFAARLSGDESAESPGVVGMTHWRVAVAEDEAQAIVTVRRAGGKSGLVRVPYATAPYIGGDADALAGSDFEAVRGELTWEDGDTTVREVAIPIIADGSTPEGIETFLLTIGSLTAGDAGLGGQATRVEIAADGSPSGQLMMQAGPTSVREGGSLQVWVERAYYGTGSVSVTLTPSGGSTVGQDFDLEPSVLTWADGEQGAKPVQINAHRDSADEEPFEEFTLTLTDPSGGAILGARTSTIVQIMDAAPPADCGGGGGSGNVGWMSLLLALCAGSLRRLGVKAVR